MRSIERITALIAAATLLLFHGRSPAQGLVMDTTLYDALPRQSDYGDGNKSAATALDGIPKIDLKPYCPKPQHQGNLGSCTAWAVGYGAMTINLAIALNLANQRKNITDTAFSALFLYNQVRENFNDCGQGSFIHKALDLLKSTGNVQSKHFDKGNNCRKRPTEADVEVASRYRIKDWVTLFSSNSSNRVRIEKTKMSLVENQPVIIAMRTRNNFNDLGPRDRYWLPYIGDTSLSFFHAMVVVGFDDGKGAFEVLNSWGESWGNKGFFWLRYEDYANHVPSAYQMMLYPGGSMQVAETKRNKGSQLSAKIVVREPTGVQNGEVQFREARFDLQNGQYVLAENAWPLGKRYQLVASELAGGSYLYMFSLDHNNQIKIHWPRDAALDDKFDGQKESAVITNSKVKLVIPTPETALILDVKGAEYLCLLISKNPLGNINEIIRAVRENHNIPLQKRLSAALGKELVVPGGINHEQSRIGFTIKDNANGSVVPIIIKIPVE